MSGWLIAVIAFAEAFLTTFSTAMGAVWTVQGNQWPSWPALGFGAVGGLVAGFRRLSGLFRVPPALPVVLLAALLFTGCAGRVIRDVVTDLAPDFKAQAAVLTGSASLLPPNAPWLACNVALQDLGAKLLAGPGLDVPGAGIFTEAARLHVLDSLIANLPTAIKQSCGEVLLTILLRAGSRLPGL